MESVSIIFRDFEPFSSITARASFSDTSLLTEPAAAVVPPVVPTAASGSVTPNSRQYNEYQGKIKLSRRITLRPPALKPFISSFVLVYCLL